AGSPGTGVSQVRVTSFGPPITSLRKSFLVVSTVVVDLRENSHDGNLTTTSAVRNACAAVPSWQGVGRSDWNCWGEMGVDRVGISTQEKIMTKRKFVLSLAILLFYVTVA